MIILFCYCAIITNYERKNINKTTIILIAAISVILRNRRIIENKQETN